MLRHKWITHGNKIFALTSFEPTNSGCESNLPTIALHLFLQTLNKGKKLFFRLFPWSISYSGKYMLLVTKLKEKRFSIFRFNKFLFGWIRSFLQKVHFIKIGKVIKLKEKWESISNYTTFFSIYETFTFVNWNNLGILQIKVSVDCCSETDFLFWCILNCSLWI